MLLESVEKEQAIPAMLECAPSKWLMSTDHRDDAFGACSASVDAEARENHGSFQYSALFQFIPFCE